MKDPKHESYEEMKDWLGEDYKEDFFDLDGVNTMLES